MEGFGTLVALGVLALIFFGGGQQPPPGRLCPRCGAKTLATMRWCETCGARVNGRARKDHDDA